MHPYKLFTLTSCYRTARDGTQILDDSKPVCVCMHKCVGQASQALYAKFVPGLEKCFWSAGDSGRRATLWEQGTQSKCIQGNSGHRK